MTIRKSMHFDEPSPKTLFLWEKNSKNLKWNLVGVIAPNCFLQFGQNFAPKTCCVRLVHLTSCWCARSILKAVVTSSQQCHYHIISYLLLKPGFWSPFYVRAWVHWGWIFVHTISNAFGFFFLHQKHGWGKRAQKINVIFKLQFMILKELQTTLTIKITWIE